MEIHFRLLNSKERTQIRFEDIYTLKTKTSAENQLV